MNRIPRISSLRFLPAAVLGLLALASESLVPARAAEVPVEIPAQLDLRTAIGFALDNNFAIRQARERIRQQEGVVLEVRSRQIPNVTATGSYQRNSTQLSPAFPPLDSAWTLDVTASQVLFSGGGVRAAARGAERGREAAVLDLRATINDALLEVRTGFFSVLLAREQVAVQEQNLALLEEQLRNVNDRFQAGTVSAFEPLRASVAVANARVPLVTARNELRLAIERLRFSLGYTNTTPENLRTTPDFLGALEYVPATYTLETAITAAQTNRPDLARLASLVAAQEETLTASRASRFPSLALVGGWQLRNGATTDFGDSRDGAFIGLRSEWDLFDGRATTGQIAQARSALEQLRLQLTEARLAAEVEVRSAFSSYEVASELAEASSQVVNQAEEALRLAIARFDAGTATQLDSLQAQVDLTTARTNLVRANYDYNVAVARLRKATGLTDPFYLE
jgi:outer membrane protein